MKLINLCPHPVNLTLDGGETMVIPQSGKVARVFGDTEIYDTPLGITIRRIVVAGIYDLPDPEEDTIYIVSERVAEATDRKDVVYPDDSTKYWLEGVCYTRCLRWKTEYKVAGIDGSWAESAGARE